MLLSPPPSMPSLPAATATTSLLLSVPPSSPPRKPLRLSSFRNSTSVVSFRPSPLSADLVAAGGVGGGIDDPALLASLSVLVRHGIDPPLAAAVVAANPDLLARPPLAALRFLLSPAPAGAGLPVPHLRAAVRRSPRLLDASVAATLMPSLRLLRRLGFRHLSPGSASLLILNPHKTLIPKLAFLSSTLALTDTAVAAIVRRCPSILSYSIETNLKPKIEFLLQDMGRSAAELEQFPQFFAFSLEKRIQPRYATLKQQMIEMSLGEMLRCSDGEFRVKLLAAKLRIIGETL